ncbi:putative CFEM domain protein [Thermoascus aurantiacus ATCC 26904]
MKLSTISLALSAVLATAAALGIDDLPECARNCAAGSIPKECNQIDVKCICSAKSFIQGITCCVAGACSKADQEATIKFANQICGSAGVTDLPQSAVCASGSATGTASTPTAASSSSSTGATSTVSGAGATTTAASTTSSSTAGSSSTAAGSATATSSGAAASTSSTGGAALVAQNQHSGFIAGVGAAAALVAMRLM